MEDENRKCEFFTMESSWDIGSGGKKTAIIPSGGKKTAKCYAKCGFKIKEPFRKYKNNVQNPQ